MTETDNHGESFEAEGAAPPLDRYVDSYDDALTEMAQRQAGAAPIVTGIARLADGRYLVQSRFAEAWMEQLLAAAEAVTPARPSFGEREPHVRRG